MVQTLSIVWLKSGSIYCTKCVCIVWLMVKPSNCKVFRLLSRIVCAVIENLYRWTKWIHKIAVNIHMKFEQFPLICMWCEKIQGDFVPLTLQNLNNKPMWMFNGFREMSSQRPFIDVKTFIHLLKTLYYNNIYPGSWSLFFVFI